MTMIRKGDRITFKPEFRDAGDDRVEFIAREDEDGGRVLVESSIPGFMLSPLAVVPVEMIEPALTVRVSVRNGVVSVDDVPPGVRVVFSDYDLDEADKALQLAEPGDGGPCVRSVYTNEDTRIHGEQ